MPSAELPWSPVSIGRKGEPNEAEQAIREFDESFSPVQSGELAASTYQASPGYGASSAGPTNYQQGRPVPRTSDESAQNRATVGDPTNDLLSTRQALEDEIEPIEDYFETASEKSPQYRRCKFRNCVHVVTAESMRDHIFEFHPRCIICNASRDREPRGIRKGTKKDDASTSSVTGPIRGSRPFGGEHKSGPSSKKTEKWLPLTEESSPSITSGCLEKKQKQDNRPKNILDHFCSRDSYFDHLYHHIPKELCTAYRYRMGTTGYGCDGRSARSTDKRPTRHSHHEVDTNLSREEAMVLKEYITRELEKTQDGELSVPELVKQHAGILADPATKKIWFDASGRGPPNINNLHSHPKLGECQRNPQIQKEISDEASSVLSRLTSESLSKLMHQGHLLKLSPTPTQEEHCENIDKHPGVSATTDATASCSCASYTKTHSQLINTPNPIKQGPMPGSEGIRSVGCSSSETNNLGLSHAPEPHQHPEPSAEFHSYVLHTGWQGQPEDQREQLGTLDNYQDIDDGQLATLHGERMSWGLDTVTTPKRRRSQGHNTSTRSSNSTTHPARKRPNQQPDISHPERSTTVPDHPFNSSPGLSDSYYGIGAIAEPGRVYQPDDDQAYGCPPRSEILDPMPNAPQLNSMMEFMSGANLKIGTFFR